MVIITFLTILFVYSGLFAGYVLSVIAPEELLPGKDYFKFAEKLLLILIIVFLTYFIPLSLFMEAFVVMFLAAVVTIIPLRSDIIFASMPLILFVVAENKDIFLVESFLVFLFGMVASTLFIANFCKKDKLVKPLYDIFIKLNKRFMFYIIVLLGLYVVSFIFFSA